MCVVNYFINTLRGRWACKCKFDCVVVIQVATPQLSESCSGPETAQSTDWSLVRGPGMMVINKYNQCHFAINNGLNTHNIRCSLANIYSYMDNKFKSLKVARSVKVGGRGDDCKGEIDNDRVLAILDFEAKPAQYKLTRIWCL